LKNGVMKNLLREQKKEDRIYWINVLKKNS
jgi:hypothetical protein